MLGPNPFPQLTPPRASDALARLKKMMWRPLSEELEVERSEPSGRHRTWEEAQSLELGPVPRPPFHWGRMWEQVWWRIKLPRAKGRGTRYLIWRDQAEATVYVDGMPHYGVDVAHQECPLPRRAEEVWVESVCCRTGIWVTGDPQAISPQGSFFEGVRLAAKDEEAWRAYQDLELLLLLYFEERRRWAGEGSVNEKGFGRVPGIEQASPDARLMLAGMEKALDAFDREGVAALRESLGKLYQSLPGSLNRIQVTMTGHAHIDLVWLWPEKVGEFKAVHSFATANRLMQLYPEFQFGYSQPASYEAVFRRSPKLGRAVKRRIKSGQWEALGAMYVESDTQLPCGEALARACVVGQKAFEKLQGKPSSTVWLPDVFGYSGCLPQIMKAAGVKHFFTTKLYWSNINEFPYSSFLWRGNDGAEVVAHVTKHRAGYNGTAVPAEILAAAATHRQSGLHRELLLPTGYGDGGGGPTPEMCERVRRMEDLATLPRTRWDRVDAFFERLAGMRDQLPVHAGEMYLEYHRGVHTTHSHLKAAFRRAERAMQAWEAAHCLSGAGPVDEQPWKRLIFAQFHDYIPGSSIHEVYEEHVPELEEIGEAAKKEAVKAVASGSGKPCWFNPLPLPRVVAAGAERRAVPPLCLASEEDLELYPDVGEVKLDGSTLENHRVRAAFTQSGLIESLEIDGVTLALGEGAGGLKLFEDRPFRYPAWDIDRAALNVSSDPMQAKRKKSVAHEDGSASLTFAVRLTEKSRAEIVYSLSPESCCLRIDYRIDWGDEEKLLKVAFPTGYRGQAARYGAPFGSALRSQKPGDVKGEAQWENPASRWAAIFDDGEAEGLFLVTKDKYGMGCHDGLLHLSLLRAAYVTRAEENRHLREIESEVNFSDMGQHSISIAIGRYDAFAPREETPAALAETLFGPLMKLGAEPRGCGLVGIEGGQSLLPCWAKPLGRDRWVLRLHETLGQRGEAVVDLEPGWLATPVDLLENPAGPALEEGLLRYRPYEMIGLLLEKR